MNSFLIVSGLANGDNGKATVGEKVTFRVGFQDSSSRTGSVRIDFGDGTSADSGPRTLERVFGVPNAYIKRDHVYTKPGTFSASLKAGSIENQPCLFSGYFGLGLVVDGKPGIRVTVVASFSKAAIRPAAAAPQAAAATKKSLVAVFPTSTPAARNLGQSAVATEKRALAHALAPGQITRASVSQSLLGNFLKVEGSGKCGLKAVDEMDGKTLRTYDFKGPLPASVQLLSTLAGKHVVKIDGDKSSESCGGTASADYWVVKPKGLS